MTIQKHNDTEGWKRGLGAYSGTGVKFDSPNVNAPKRFVNGEVMSDKLNEAPGRVSSGGPPRYKPKTGPISVGGPSGAQRVKGR